MKDFESLAIARRSTRKFKNEKISPDEAQKIFQAALLAPTAKNGKSWEFVAVENKDTLRKLSECKEAGGAFVADCALAIVVLGDKSATDTWVEDASIAAAFMQLQAEDLGLGSCWCHVHDRSRADGKRAEDYVRELLEIPSNFGVLCIIAIGYKDIERKLNDLSKLTWEKIHIEKFPSSDKPLMA